MKVGVFSKVPIFPPYGGNRARILKLCVSLRALGCDVEFYLLPSRQSRNCDFEQHRKFFGAGHFVALSSPRRERLVLDAYKFFRCAIVYIAEAFSREPAPIDDIDYLYPTYLDAHIKDIARQKNFDVVVAEYVHFSRLLDNFSSETFKVLDTHDSFGSEFTSTAETKGFLRADCVLAIQEQEGELFKAQLRRDADRVRVVSHLVDVHQMVDLTECKGATFFGSDFEANVLSLNYFIREILPLVLERLPTFKLFIAGAVAHAAERHPAVIKVGEVANVADAFREAPVLVNSIVAGTGVKIKLLEAFGLGVPSVSTQTGAIGIPCQYLAGARIVADNDASGFAEELVKLVTDAEYRQSLGKAALKAALEWNAAQMSSLEDVLHEARSRRPPLTQNAIAS